jgi:hypothetical protein
MCHSDRQIDPVNSLGFMPGLGCPPFVQTRVWAEKSHKSLHLNIFYDANGWRVSGALPFGNPALHNLQDI